MNHKKLYLLSIIFVVSSVYSMEWKPGPSEQAYIVRSIRLINETSQNFSHVIATCKAQGLKNGDLVKIEGTTTFDLPAEGNASIYPRDLLAGNESIPKLFENPRDIHIELVGLNLGAGNLFELKNNTYAKVFIISTTGEDNRIVVKASK